MNPHRLYRFLMRAICMKITSLNLTDKSVVILKDPDLWMDDDPINSAMHAKNLVEFIARIRRELRERGIVPPLFITLRHQDELYLAEDKVMNKAGWIRVEDAAKWAKKSK